MCIWKMYSLFISAWNCVGARIDGDAWRRQNGQEQKNKHILSFYKSDSMYFIFNKCST